MLDLPGLGVNFPGLFAKEWMDAIVLYNNFFLSRYIARDISLICGSVFDQPGAKTLILFVFVYSATRNIQSATLATFVILVANYWMSSSKVCYPVAEKSESDALGMGFWATKTADGPVVTPIDISGHAFMTSRMVDDVPN
jgi:hypothetical protein